MMGKTARSDVLAFGRLLDGAADLDPVGGRKRVPEGGQGRPDGVAHRPAAATPSRTSARTVIAMSRLRRHRMGSSDVFSISGNLRDRHRDAVMRYDGEVTDAAEVQPFRCRGASHDGDLFGAVSYSGDGHGPTA